MRLNVMESAIGCDLDVDTGAFASVVSALPRIDWQRWLAQVLSIADAGLNGALPVHHVSKDGKGLVWRRCEDQSPIDAAISAHRWRSWHYLCFLAEMVKETNADDSSSPLHGDHSNSGGAYKSDAAGPSVGRPLRGGSSSEDVGSVDSDGDGSPIKLGSRAVRSDHTFTALDLENCVVELWTKWARWSVHDSAAAVRWNHHVVEEVRGMVFGEAKWYVPRGLDAESPVASHDVDMDHAVSPEGYLNLPVPQV